MTAPVGITSALMTLATTSDRSLIVAITIFVAILSVSIVLGHLLEENRWMNESITALLIGLATGALILLSTKGKSSRILAFREDIFFIYLLPPIIFNAGFQVKKKQFFRNFMTIMLFGAIGTFISFIIISLGAMEFVKRTSINNLDIKDFLAIGAIFAATDSVCTLQVLNQDETPLLYSLVFGEGVVNDATSVVLFNAIEKFDLVHMDLQSGLQFFGSFFYLFTTSTLLGAAAGLISAFTIKILYFGRHSTDREVSLMMLMAYLSYMLAELLDLSGILTVFFCGIVMSHYTWHNVTESSRITTKHSFATLSFIAEIAIFLYVGMDALDIEKWQSVSDSPGESIGLSAALLGLTLLGRAAFVFPLSFLSNLTKKYPHELISFKHQVVIWWAGLMRGAVSVALAYNKFANSEHTQKRGYAFLITSTMTVVLFSMMVFGLLTKPLTMLLFPVGVKRQDSISSDASSPKTLLFAPLLLGEKEGSEIEAGGQSMPCRPSAIHALLTEPAHSVHHYWRRFDDAFMRPIFGGRGFVPFVPGSPTERSVHPW